MRAIGKNMALIGPDSRHKGNVERPVDGRVEDSRFGDGDWVAGIRPLVRGY